MRFLDISFRRLAFLRSDGRYARVDDSNHDIMKVQIHMCYRVNRTHRRRDLPRLAVPSTEHNTSLNLRSRPVFPISRDRCLENRIFVARCADSDIFIAKTNHFSSGIRYDQVYLGLYIWCTLYGLLAVVVKRRNFLINTALVFYQCTYLITKPHFHAPRRGNRKAQWCKSHQVTSQIASSSLRKVL
jgi:hypothetical protein